MTPQIYAPLHAAMVGLGANIFFNEDGEERRSGDDRRDSTDRRSGENRRGGDRSHLVPRRIRGDRREQDETGGRRGPPTDDE